MGNNHDVSTHSFITNYLFYSIIYVMKIIEE